MFRFTIRDVLWLIVVVALAADGCGSLKANHGCVASDGSKSVVRRGGDPQPPVALGTRRVLFARGTKKNLRHRPRAQASVLL